MEVRIEKEMLQREFEALN